MVPRGGVPSLKNIKGLPTSGTLKRSIASLCFLISVSHQSGPDTAGDEFWDCDSYTPIRSVQPYSILNFLAPFVGPVTALKRHIHKGPRLLENVDVQRDIERFMDAIGEKTGVTVAGIVSELKEQTRIATDLGHTAAAVRAIELIGKTIGAFTDRTETVESHEDRLRDRLKAASEENVH